MMTLEQKCREEGAKAVAIDVKRMLLLNIG